MVQILPPKTNLGSQIGQTLGQGLQQGMNQGFQRGLLQQSLGKARDLSQQKGTSPLQLALGLMEAGAGIPGSERYLATLLPLLLQQGASGFLPNLGEQGSQTNTQILPQGAQSVEPGAAAPNAPHPIANTESRPAQMGQNREVEGLPLANFVPMDVGQLISPEQSSQIVKNVIASGGDPNLARQFISDYNKGKIDINELLNQNVDRAFAQTQRRRQLESGALNFINTQLPDQPQAFKNVAYGMLARELGKKPYEDLTQAWQQVASEFVNFDKEYKAFQGAIPQGDLLGINQRTLDNLQRRSKSILEKDPLAYNILEEAFKQKGQSIVTAAQVLNKLPENVQKIASGVSDYRPILFPRHDVSEKKMSENIEKAEREQIGHLPSIVDKLVKNWNTNLSLINIYAEMKKRGWTQDALSRMISSLKNFVDFSPQQEAEATQLAKPPKMPPLFLMK